MDHSETLKNLILMAAADGSFTQQEIQLLSDRASDWGISTHEFASAMEHVLSNEPSLTIPASKHERLDLLQDMVRMMGSDGNVAEQEKQLLALAAVTMSISTAELNEVIDKVLDQHG